MPLDKDAVNELKQKIKLARNKELNFALALGKKPEDCAIMMHKERGGDKLLLKVKKENGVQPQKSCYGTLSVDGQLLKLMCKSDPPAGLVKNFRVFFRANSIPIKLAVLTPGGEAFEGDDEGEQEAQAESQAPDSSAPPPEEPAPAASGLEEAEDPLAAIKAQIKELNAGIAKLAGPVKDKLAEGLKKAAALAAAGKIDKAEALLEQLAKALNKAASIPSPPPPPPPPDGDPDGNPAEEAGEKPDPLAERWEVTSSKVAPHVAKALKSGKGDPDKIRAVWSFAQGKAEAGDYAAALKALGPLSNLLSQAAEAEKTAAQEEVDKGDDTRQKLQAWEATKAQLEPKVMEIVKAKDARSTKVGAAWEMALKAASTGDFDTANKIVGRLRSALGLDEAGPAPSEGASPQQSEAPQAQAGDRADKADDDKPASDDPARNKALGKIDKVKGDLTRVEGLIAAFGTPQPKEWELPIKSAAKMLAIAEDKEIKDLEAAATEASALLAELEPKVKQLTLDKEAWEKQHPLFVARLVPIQAHATHDIDPIKGKLKDLEDEVKAAEADAAGFDFKGAAGRIGAFLSLADVVEALADGFAHYRKIQMDRTILVTPKRGMVAARAPVQAAIDELIDTYDKGVQKAGDEKYPEAVEEMNKVPQLLQKVELLLDRAKAVDGDPADATDAGQIGTTLDYLNALNGFPDPVKLMLKTGIDRVQAAYDASLPAAEPDVIKASERLTLAIRDADDLWTRGQKAEAYVDLRATFDTKLRDFKAHAGKEGIEDVIERMENDSTSAASDAILRKFDSATRLLQSSQADWPSYEARAADYVAYKTKRDAVKTRLEDLRKLPEAATATDELATADAHLRQAATLAATRDYKSALDSANAADAAADVAKNLIDMRTEMAKLKKDDVLAAVDKDVVAAFKNYDDLAKFVEGKDDGTFTALRGTADAEAQKGRDASVGPDPDHDKIREHLGNAISQLEAVIDSIACKAAFTSLRAAIKPAVENELPTGSAANDNCLSTDLPPITALLTAADDAVKDPRFDFGTGLAKVNEANTEVQKARKKLALYTEAKDPVLWLAWAKGELITSRDEALTHTNPIDAKASLQVEIDRITAFETAFTTDWAAGKHAAATAKVKADMDRAIAYEAYRADYVETIEQRQDWILDREGLIAGDPLVAAERQEVADAKAAIAGLLETRSYTPAKSLCANAYFVIERGKDMLQARTDYEVKRAAAEAKVQEAETAAGKVPTNAELAAEAAALRKRYNDAHAETAVDKRRFDFAGTEMEALTNSLCQPVIDRCTDYEAFEGKRAAVAAKIQEVKDHKNSDLITPLITRLDGKYANMMDLASKGHMNQAKALLDVLPQDCEDALVAAKNNAALDGIGKDLETMDEDDTDAIKAAVEALRETFDNLRWESEAQYAQSHDLAENLVEAIEAKLASDPKAAKAALPEALQACKDLQTEIGHHKQLSELATRVIARITSVTAPFEKYAIIKEDADALKAAVTAALEGAQSGGDLDTASTAIEEVMTKHHALMIMAVRHDQVIKDRDALEAQHKTLLGSEYRYAIREDLEKLSALLEQAGEAAEKRDHDTAEKRIKTAKEVAVDAVAKNKMAGNQAPDADNIKSILERPDGDAQLDAMIKDLDPSVQRKVLRVAFEAKYGCKLNIYVEAKDEAADRHDAANIVADGSKKGPNIRRLYEVMSILPVNDTRDNDSMKIFGWEDVETQEGSYYSGGDVKEVVMREGNANLSDVYGFGRPHEVGEVDENCKPADDEQVDFFSWNTLHEAGHAVDDQRNFMGGVKGNASYGGWQEHGINIKPIADAIAGHYKYDPTYTADYILGTVDPALPVCPDNVEPEEWERRRSKVHAHVDMAREGNNPWQSAAIAAKLNVGGRVYHESYTDPSYWSSYEFAARKQAITGYQFRAPGEWFSELYAAYHSKKLKDQHPAVQWLKDLK